VLRRQESALVEKHVYLDGQPIVRASGSIRTENQTSTREETAKILGISCKGLFLKHRRWGLRA
jgi:hypothetical protein